MPVMYRKSEVTTAITVARPINTTTTIEVRGADDSFATDRREFSTEEEIRINGSVTADDKADLTAGKVEVYLDNVYLSDVPLTFDPATGANNYEYTLGLLIEGVHNIRVFFPKLRLFAASLVEARIGAGLPPIELKHVAIAILALFGAIGVGVYAYKRR